MREGRATHGGAEEKSSRGKTKKTANLLSHFWRKFSILVFVSYKVFHQQE